MAYVVRVCGVKAFPKGQTPYKQHNWPPRIPGTLPKINNATLSEYFGQEKANVI